MRISNDNYYRTLLSDLSLQQCRIAEKDKHIATGKVMNSPSDAPAEAITVLDSRYMIATGVQYRSNMTQAKSWLTNAEESMDSMQDLLTRARVLAEKMATGTYSKSEQIGQASEISNILEELRNLANTKTEGAYIFGGSDIADAPITALLTPQEIATMIQDSGPGHDTIASYWVDLDGNYRLRLSRGSTGSGATVGVVANNTLGDSVAGINFDWPGQWAQNRAAADNPPQGQIITSLSTVSSTTTGLVSAIVGETLSWTPNSTIGLQTYRTDGVLSVTGGCTVDLVIGGATNTYDATGASDLVDQINAAANPNYFAWLEGSTTVHVVSTGSTFSLSDNGSPPGNLAIDQDTTMQELIDEINAGLKAAGVIRMSGPPPANFQPQMDQTITIGDQTWTWGQITNDTTLATAGDYANALTAWVNSHSDSISATTVFSGSGANIQLSGRAIGMASNVTIASSNTTISTSGALWGGMGATEPTTTGRLYATGSSSLRLGTTIEGTVLAVSGSTVSVRLRWFDDDGILHEQDADLSGDGENNSVDVLGTGGVKVYRDSLTFHEGAEFEIKVGHFQGNQEDMQINFSDFGGRLTFNYNAKELLGDVGATSLISDKADPRTNAGTGNVMLTGAYRGTQPREITYDVLESGQVPGDNVLFRVSWVGDDGNNYSEEVALTGAGIENGVVLPINGTRPKVDLDGMVPTADAANTGTGVVRFTGEYRGLASRDFDIQCVNDGSAPGDDLTLRVTWTDDQGVVNQKDVAVPKSGLDNKVEVPGSDGVYIYVDDINTFQVNDRYTQEIDMYPDNAGDGVFFHVDNGTFTQGDSFYQEIEKEQVHVIDTLTELEYQLRNGTVEQGQTASQKALEELDLAVKQMIDSQAGAGTRLERITVRENVLNANDEYATANLAEFQNVDVAEAYLELTAMQNVYSTSLKSMSMLMQLSLLEML